MPRSHSGRSDTFNGPAVIPFPRWSDILRVEFQTVPSGVVADLATHIPAVRRINYENVFYAGDGDWIESLVVSANADFDPVETLGLLTRVELFHHDLMSTDAATETTRRITIVAHEPYPFLLGVILRGKAIPNRLELRDGALHGVVTVREWEDFRTLADTIQEQFGRFAFTAIAEGCSAVLVGTPDDPVEVVGTRTAKTPGTKCVV